MLNVGDRVVVVRRRLPSIHFAAVGAIGTVIRITRNDTAVDVKFEAGSPWLFDWANLRTSTDDEPRPIDDDRVQYGVPFCDLARLPHQLQLFTPPTPTPRRR
jgi:hypothetical protein